MMVFLPQRANVADASRSAAVPLRGQPGCLEREAMWEISEWKCDSKGGRRRERISRKAGAEKDAAEGRVVR
jgi:hypothetical protein